MRRPRRRRACLKDRGLARKLRNRVEALPERSEHVKCRDDPAARPASPHGHAEMAVARGERRSGRPEGLGALRGGQIRARIGDKHAPLRRLFRHRFPPQDPDARDNRRRPLSQDAQPPGRRQRLIANADKERRRAAKHRIGLSAGLPGLARLVRRRPGRHSRPRMEALGRDRHGVRSARVARCRPVRRPRQTPEQRRRFVRRTAPAPLRPRPRHTCRAPRSTRSPRIGSRRAVG